MGRRSDVVVVGAGPAGCAAAATLARAGRSVVLVTGRRPERRFAVGEGAPPGLDRAVDDVFGIDTFVAADHLRSLGNRAAWGTEDLLGTDFMFNPFGTGWHLDRVAFDDRLLAAAGAAGAELRPMLDREPADVAPMVVDATGRRSAIARDRGARRFVADRLIAAVAWFDRGDGDGDATTTVEAVESGWWYTSPIPHRARVVAFLTDGDLLTNDVRTREGFVRAVGRTTHVAALAPGSPVGAPVVVAAETARLDPMAGDGWIATGDAAASFDPLSSQGILTAVLMGREAGRCADDRGSYAARYREIVDRYDTERRAMYRQVDRWPSAPFWQRRRDPG